MASGWRRYVAAFCLRSAQPTSCVQVITTNKQGNQLVTTTTYRPGAAWFSSPAGIFAELVRAVGQNEVSKTQKPAEDELLDIEALVDGPPKKDARATRSPRQQEPQLSPRQTQGCHQCC